MLINIRTPHNSIPRRAYKTCIPHIYITASINCKGYSLTTDKTTVSIADGISTIKHAKLIAESVAGYEVDWNLPPHEFCSLPQGMEILKTIRAAQKRIEGEENAYGLFTRSG